MVDSSGATGPLNLDSLQDDTLRRIFRRVGNQADSAASQRSINALRNVNQHFRAIVDSEFREETRSARFEEAMVEAGNSARTTTANDIIIYHGLDDPGTQNMIKERAAMRDIKAGVRPSAAIERNGVDNPGTQNMLKERAAMRDIKAGMKPSAAIERNGVDDPVAQKTIAMTIVKPNPLVAASKVAARVFRGSFSAARRHIRNLGSGGRLTREFITLQAAIREIDADPEMVAGTVINRNGVTDPVTGNTIKEHAAMRDVMAGMVAGTAIGRNDVDNPVTRNTIKEHAAMRDIIAGMVAGTAIGRNDVDNPVTRNRLKWRAAERDVAAGVAAGIAIQRHGVVYQQDHSDVAAGVDARIAIERQQDDIKWRAAERDINAGVAAHIAIERHGVNNQEMQDSIKQHALKRDINAGVAARTAQERHNLDPCPQNSGNAYGTRGLDERPRQEEGRGR
ncbi:hypothetical protein HFO27_36990 [Rhizobium leguminosarum]|uniref:hypothetical protein n=1 Tax=Rhizobium leguminosarum TaxID=384 RepID=UPI001C909640|nr:hypothetical protein [Rhizobium leguminosarum]MBY3180009.1 hypothetical protein [Rhizobium leguminosarum]